jgi:hypothetical protein
MNEQRNAVLDGESHKLSVDAIEALFSITCNATRGYMGDDFTFEDIIEGTMMQLQSFPLTQKQMKQALALAIYFMKYPGMNDFQSIFYPDYDVYAVSNDDENEADRFSCFDEFDDEPPF